MNGTKALLLALAAVNLLAFFLCGLDKQYAKHVHWRIPERTLMLVSACGGSVGMLLGMSLFRHKTKHPKFYLGVPALLLLQLAAAWYFLK